MQLDTIKFYYLFKEKWDKTVIYRNYAKKFSLMVKIIKNKFYYKIKKCFNFCKNSFATHGKKACLSYDIHKKK